MKPIHALHLVMLLTTACTEPGKPPSPAQPNNTAAGKDTINTAATRQISQYIRCMFQDRDGNLWFGTTSDGVCRYDGRSLIYFKQADGLSDWVNDMAQDAQGDLWFATRDGVARYNTATSLSAGSTHFTRYTTKDSLANNYVWCLLLDKSGVLWCGTQEGVSRYDGKTFTPFPIPAADLSKFPYYQDPKQINSIIQDKAGNIWFATNGGGAYRYDGKTLTNISEKDGLCDNFVQTILEDRTGNLWFGTRFGGLCKYDGNAFTTFARNDLKGDNVFALYQDSAGTIWIGVTATGLCSYDGIRFECYTDRDGAGVRVVMSMLEDASGKLWFGTGAGVYRFVGGTFTNWTKEAALSMGAP